MQAVRHIAKRLCRRTDDDLPSDSPTATGPPVDDDPSDPSYRSDTQPCLLPLLQPVRYCLHPFLNSSDAAHLMQASRSITVALLADYPLADHVFDFSQYQQCEHLSLSAVKRCVALYARYHMRITRMCLPANFTGPLLGSWSGAPLLPSSLLALSLGQESTTGRRSIAHCAFDGSDEPEVGDEEWWEWCGPDAEGDNREFYRLIRPVSIDGDVNTSWTVREYGSCAGRLNQHISPGALPRGLRFLQFNDAWNRPLQVGSIPDTVEVAQLGRDFHHPLEVGHLPASLTQLHLGSCYNHVLVPDVLPAGLQQLQLSGSYDRPIQPGALPAQLKGLHLGFDYDLPLIPGAIPATVTHLRFSHLFSHSLQPGSIPEGVVHLNIDDCEFNHPLLPGVLPTSLRELVLGMKFNHPLQPGSLPDGLELLAFIPWASFEHTLQPGVIPASVVVVDLPENYTAELVAGGIPATVKWLRLPDYYRDVELTDVLSPATRVVWWSDGWRRWEL